MANFIFSLLYTQTQLAAAYLMLNLALISLTLSKSLSDIHTLTSHSILLAPFRLMIFMPLASLARCVLAQMKMVLARIAMRLVSDARSNGHCLFQNDHQGGSQIRDYSTDTELLDAYLELMNIQNQVLLAGLECLMRVFFLFPLSLFYTETETRESVGQDKNVHASVQFPPSEAEDQRPAHNNHVHDDDILMPVQFPLTSGTEERVAQDKNAHDIILVPVPGTEEQPTQDKSVLVPVIFPSTSGTAEQAADDKNAHENNMLVPVQFSATSVVVASYLLIRTEEEQVARDKDVPVQLPPASGTEERAADYKNTPENNILVPVHFSSTSDEPTKDLVPDKPSSDLVKFPPTPETGTEEHVAQDKNAHDNNILVAVHFPPTSEAALEDPVPDKPSFDGINSKKNLSAGTDLIPLSCSYGKLVHAVHEGREMLVRKLKANNRLSSKVYTIQSKVCTIQVKMAKV